MRKFVESRFFITLTVALYLALAGVLFYIMSTRTKPEIEFVLAKLVPEVLFAGFLLIAIGVILCRCDITAAFSGLFALAYPHPHHLRQGEKELHPTEGDDGERDQVQNTAETHCSAAWKGEVQWALPFRLGRLILPGVWLLAIFIVGLLLVSQVAPQTHRIYYDEDIYANMGQNIAHTAQTGMANFATFEYGEYFIHWLLYNKDPGGWPFLISLAFRLFGTDETFAFYLNNLLFAGGILIVFFITRLLAGGRLSGLLPAMIYTLIPHNLIWSNTIAAEVPAAFFGGLTVLCTLVWLRTRKMRHLFLFMIVLPFACYMRPESALIALWALAAVAMNLFSIPSPHPGSHPTLFRHPLATRSFWAMRLIAFALIIPHIWHLYAVSGQSWGADGAKFATSFFTKNLAVNGPYFLNNKEFPILFTLLAFVGLAA